MRCLELQDRLMEMRRGFVGVGGVFILVLGVNDAKEHDRSHTVGGIFLNGFEKDINRLLMYPWHAPYGFIHALAIHNKVRLDEGLQDAAAEEEVSTR
jgi:hypothetical protein